MIIALMISQFPPKHVAVGDWLMLHGSTGHNGFGALRGRISGWSVKYTVSLCTGESQPVVGDINADGLPEIVFGCLGGLGASVIALRGNTGSTLWSTSYPGGSWGAPAAADLIPSIPGLEVVVCSSTNTQLLRGTDGSVIWTASVGCGSNAGAPAVAHDGPDTLILVNDDGTLYALNPLTGSVRWSAPSGGNTLIGIAKSPAINDIDGDGNLEVVVAGNGTVYAYDFRTGAALWSVSVGTRYYTRTPATLVDLTGDCVDEVIVSNDNGHIYALRGTDGSVLWDYVISGQMACGPISTADLNGDSINDVIVGHLRTCSCGTPGGVTVINGASGLPLWSNTFTGPNMTHGGGRVVSDFDSDGQLEIAVVPYWSSYMCFGDGVFRMFNGTGGIEWTAGGVVGEGSSFADVDGDGCSEILVLPSAGRNILVVVDNDAVSDCGAYPYNDTCGIIGSNDETDVSEASISYVFTEVEGRDGGILIKSNRNSLVRIYRPDGRLVLTRGVLAGETFLNLKPGTYVVLINRRSFTVLVR
ncbi:MAG: PQQ-binding-like beta-propeller repeat protein [Thermotogae bacterium]|nr:PQQ-binding-like beta-propeller repeat protein [Thermotogota bacterium]